MDTMTRLSTYWAAPCKSSRWTVAGSSLLETVISLTILLCILTLSFTRLDRINHSVNPQVLYKAHLISSEMIQRDDFLIEKALEQEVDGFRVEKSIEAQEQGVFLIELSIYNKAGRLVHQRSLLKFDGIEL